MLRQLTAAAAIAATCAGAPAHVAQPLGLPNLAMTHGQCARCEARYALAALHLDTLAGGFATASFLPPGNGSGVSTVLRTDDGGRHWEPLGFVRQRSAEQTPALFSLDAKHVWIGSFDSWTAKGLLSRTSDGGHSWTHLSSPPIHALQFFTANDGYSVAADQGATTFRRTRDGGRTWQETPLPFSYVDAMSFFDRDVGVIAGTAGNRSRMVSTRDGGLQWVDAALPAVLDQARAQLVRWRSRSEVLAVFQRMRDEGDVIVASLDGGHEWKQILAAPFQSARLHIGDVVVDRRGWTYVFCERGGEAYVAMTTDGQTWRTTSLPVAVTSCQMFSERFVCSAGLDLLTFQLPARSP